jgi:hypothetical protein
MPKVEALKARWIPEPVPAREIVCVEAGLGAIDCSIAHQNSSTKLRCAFSAIRLCLNPQGPSRSGGPGRTALPAALSTIDPMY